MRILVVSTWYPHQDAPFRTPFIPRHVRAIARDHEVHVIHVRLMDRAAPSEDTYQGIGVTRVGFDPRTPASILRTLRVIRRWARTADVVHTMAFSAALVAAPLLLRKPWVHTEHWNGVLFPEHVNTLWQRVAWLRHVLRLPNVVTGVSTLMTRTLDEFARPGATQLVGNVVESRDKVVPAPSDSLRLIGVGAATEHKGAELAVETVALLRSRGHEASLRWDGDGPRRAEALRRAQELGIAEHVDFPGFRGPEELWDDLERASVFILPSKSETFCGAAAEALAAGRPVVMGAEGGQRDFITPDNGRMVTERTPEAFGEAVLQVAQDPRIVPPHELAERIRTRYGFDAVADQFTGIYRSIS